MRRIILAVVLLSGVAFAQGLPPPSAGSGGTTDLTGQLHLDSSTQSVQGFKSFDAGIDIGSGAKDYFQSDGGTIFTPGQFAAQSLVLDGGISLLAGSKICLDGPTACTASIEYSLSAIRLSSFGSLEVNSAVNTYGTLRSTNTGATSFTAEAASGEKALNVTTNGARVDFGAGASDYCSSDGTTVTFAGPVKSAATQTRGTITLAAGTGAATVLVGAVCACTDTTALQPVQCTVAATTLTATGTATDAIAYICF